METNDSTEYDEAKMELYLRNNDDRRKKKSDLIDGVWGISLQTHLN